MFTLRYFADGMTAARNHLRMHSQQVRSHRVILQRIQQNGAEYQSACSSFSSGNLLLNCLYYQDLKAAAKSDVLASAQDQEYAFLIAGYNRAIRCQPALRSLVAGGLRWAALRYVSEVGTGFSNKVLASLSLSRQLQPHAGKKLELTHLSQISCVKYTARA